ncbi:ABC1 kinase family protein [Marinoscillum furvescens]|uniref:Putative unusual protein kinase regulating ubiquinone biosynthesis (AarF/ABC1/UbiB family) n=1 Tax=Marinoscillum furvescens DSM 4134 TaxID=1122208 RepID=A0A3D9L0Y2_MARFU|nr:AarF/ABC1/UbiB kinase family protein [Marinoscillum furvescens]RED97415.1 putative unusual protein kinase regulating ubiquinone biosynthesis (AarF/ABC1/UbiB family) [Marinoscillum furvescens DSM 4134]
MKEQSKIPVGKVSRAARFVKTGAKVGGNYLKHYGRKLRNPETDRVQLDKENAEDIYDSLSELKGSALKVAQMLAMDKNLLPTAYQDKFAMSQYSAPPLSFPLVVKTFKTSFGKGPLDMFDSFTKAAVNAASIGQVHRAEKDGKVYAVKIQYPGVSESVQSDLKLVKPFALRLFGLNERELDQYMDEVESKLLEETDYNLEVRRSMKIGKACAHIPNLIFPEYYPEMSADRVITMDWVDGKHIKEFLASNPSQEFRNQIGQAIWDFYHHQIHNLREVHADPHPGNFLMREDGTLGIIDFGCVKEIPESFYDAYFRLMSKDLVADNEALMPILYGLNFIYEDDSEAELELYIGVFKELTGLLGRPFHTDTFDFADDAYFNEIYALSEKLGNMKELRNSKHARGSRHGLYINRTYFGLYQLLNMLGAKVTTTKPDWLR